MSALLTPVDIADTNALPPRAELRRFGGLPIVYVQARIEDRDDARECVAAQLRGSSLDFNAAEWSVWSRFGNELARVSELSRSGSTWSGRVELSAYATRDGSARSPRPVSVFSHARKLSSEKLGPAVRSSVERALVADWFRSFAIDRARAELVDSGQLDQDAEVDMYFLRPGVVLHGSRLAELELLEAAHRAGGEP